MAQSKGYRSILNVDQLKKVTNKPVLLNSLPPEKYEVELVRFGCGQIFGEIRHVANKRFFDDPKFGDLFAMQRTSSKSIPIKIKCASQTGGEVLRMTAIEFFKNVMSNPHSASLIEKQVKSKILKFYQSQARRFQSIRD